MGIDAKKAQKLILKLSDMMRYSIYEGERDFVALKEEVDYLKNYIELHRMRYHKEINVQFKIQIEDDCSIMPLLFIILLENAFKHGAQIDGVVAVNINLKVDENTLNFTIENSAKNNENSKKGIGLENIKKRLEMVHPKNHFLEILQEEKKFRVNIKIPIKNEE